MMPDLVALLPFDAHLVQPQQLVPPIVLGLRECSQTLPPPEPGRVATRIDTAQLLCQVKRPLRYLLFLQNWSEVAHCPRVLF